MRSYHNIDAVSLSVYLESLKRSPHPQQAQLNSILKCFCFLNAISFYTITLDLNSIEGELHLKFQCQRKACEIIVNSQAIHHQMYTFSKI